ncbi:MAG: ABC transporter permease [Anaerolineales bacterium]|nr:ABC transporter permease [Anaerolineales bacterium]
MNQELTQPAATLTTSPAVGEIVPTVRLQPSKGWVSLGLRELWEYRELLFFLVWRDIKVRYKQTVLGAGWAVLQPVFTMVVFGIIFGRIANVSSDGIPRPIFYYTGLIAHFFFANALTQSSNSLLASAGMIKKIYFPRLTVPLASVMAGLVDFALSFVVLLVMMFYYGIVPTVNILWLPLLLLLILIFALGMGLWFSALNAQFRDVRYIVPFLTQAFLFLTPIAFPLSALPANLQVVAAINPMTGVVEGFRWALLGTDTAPDLALLFSAVGALVLFISGAFYFRRMEKTVADVM